MSLSGIDVSSWQGAAIDWNAVAGAGYAFSLAKATEGVGYVNPAFAAQWTGAQAAGLVRAAYHFALPNQNSAPDEAAYFLKAVAANGGLLPGDALALDVEAGNGDLLPWVSAFLQATEAAVGFKPFLYSRTEFMASHGLLDPSLADNGLWLAQYQAQQPPAPAPWEFVAIWQSGQGNVPGISGLVDLNTFNGDRTALLKYGAPPKPAWDDAARLKLVGYISGGSGPADIAAWVRQYE